MWAHNRRAFFQGASSRPRRAHCTPERKKKTLSTAKKITRQSQYVLIGCWGLGASKECGSSSFFARAWSYRCDPLGKPWFEKFRQCSLAFVTLSSNSSKEILKPYLLIHLLIKFIWLIIYLFFRYVIDCLELTS